MKDEREDSRQHRNKYDFELDEVLPEAGYISDQSSSGITGFTSLHLEEISSTRIFMNVNVRRDVLEVNDVKVQGTEEGNQYTEEKTSEAPSPGENEVNDLILLQKKVLARLGLGIHQQPETSVSSLVADLRSLDEETRAQAAHALRKQRAQVVGDLQETAVTKLRILALADRDWKVRVAAVRALGALGGGAAASSLTISLQRDAHEAVQEAAAQTLGELGAEAPLGPLMLVLESRDSHWSVRAATVQAMARIGERALIDHIVIALDDDDVSVRIEAIRALRRLEGQTAEPRLRMIAQRDNQKLARLEALKMLRDLGIAIDMLQLPGDLDIPITPVIPIQEGLQKEEKTKLIPFQPRERDNRKNEPLSVDGYDAYKAAFPTLPIPSEGQQAACSLVISSPFGKCQQEVQGPRRMHWEEVIADTSDGILGYLHLLHIFIRNRRCLIITGASLAAVIVLVIVGWIAWQGQLAQRSSAAVSSQSFHWKVVPNKQVEPGQQFDLSITIVNDGPAWTENGGYQVTCGKKNDPGMSCMGVTSLDLENPALQTGHSYTIRIPLTAPTSPGKYNIWWVIEQNGQTIGEKSPSVEIDVQLPHIIRHYILLHTRALVVMPEDTQWRRKGLW